MAVMSQIARINPRYESFFAAVYEGISQNARTTDWLLRNVLTSCSASAVTDCNGCGGSNRDRRRCAYTW